MLTRETPDLIEVDLSRLTVVGCESFPWSITALSTTDAGVPLTVGTNNGSKWSWIVFAPFTASGVF